jgi:hypothetical protein
MAARSEQEREFPLFSRSLIPEERLFEPSNLGRRKRLTTGPDFGRPTIGQITFQNRLFDSVVRSAG